MDGASPLLGIFDSGIGGFSVYKKLRNVTTVNCLYYGDCMHAPYGNRDDAEIIEFIKDDIRFLQDEGVTYFVNACNSMSVMTTDLILNECKVDRENYTDMIRAFSKHATFSKGEKVLVFATKATLRSRVYQDFLEAQGVTAFEYCYEDLAGAIEANSPKQQLIAIIESGMTYAGQCGATKIIYGCTHYPLVHELFMEVATTLSWDGEFIDPGAYVAREVASWNLEGEKRLTPYSSKDTPAFIQQIASLF